MKNATAWTINGLLAVILVLLGYYCFCQSLAPAYAAGGGWETNGIMAMHSGNNQADRLVLIDTKKQNIMVYRTLGQGTFRLIGARSFKYDLELDDTSSNQQTENFVSKGITFAETYKIYQTRPKP